MNKNEIKLILSGLTCANCANKIETRVNNLEGVKEASLNFTTSTLSIEGNGNEELMDIILKAKEIINKLEPEVKVFHKDEENVVIENVNRCTSKTCSVENNISNKDQGHTSKKEDSHSHEHSHNEAINLKENLSLIIGAIIFAVAMVLDRDSIITLVLFILSYLLIGGNVILTAVKNILRGEVFDENFLMSIATIGAFGVGEFAEAVGVMMFYRIGELFEEKAVERSRSQIMDVIDMRPEVVNLVDDHGDVTVIDAEEAEIGDILLVRPGDRIPLDGIITDGETMIDTSPVTGEPIPVSASVGTDVTSGCLNTSGVIKIKVEKVLEESMVTRIMDSVENAAARWIVLSHVFLVYILHLSYFLPLQLRSFLL